MARRLAIGSVPLSDRVPRIVAAGGEAELEALVGADGADLVELRADLCDDPRPETLPALLGRLRAGGRPVILTARAAAEGGRPMDEARRRALYTAGLPHADAIDLEVASTALAVELVPRARAAGRPLLLSAHALHATAPGAPPSSRSGRAWRRASSPSRAASGAASGGGCAPARPPAPPPRRARGPRASRATRGGRGSGSMPGSARAGT